MAKSVDSMRLAQIAKQLENGVNSIKDPLERNKNICNNLSAWADETVIGNDIRENMKVINSGMNALIESSTYLKNELSDYAERILRIAAGILE